MSSHRLERISEAIREVVSSAILFDVSDPRVRNVTVLGVEVSGDLRNATIYVSVMGSETQQKQSLAGLKHATGYLQAKVAARLQTRFTPVLTFKRDDSVKKSIVVTKLLDELRVQREQGEAGGDAADEFVEQDDDFEESDADSSLEEEEFEPDEEKS